MQVHLKAVIDEIKRFENMIEVYKDKLHSVKRELDQMTSKASWWWVFGAGVCFLGCVALGAACAFFAPPAAAIVGGAAAIVGGVVSGSKFNVELRNRLNLSDQQELQEDIQQDIQAWNDVKVKSIEFRDSIQAEINKI